MDPLEIRVEGRRLILHTADDSKVGMISSLGSRRSFFIFAEPDWYGPVCDAARRRFPTCTISPYDSTHVELSSGLFPCAFNLTLSDEDQMLFTLMAT